jgi:uncharacterized protein
MLLTGIVRSTSLALLVALAPLARTQAQGQECPPVAQALTSERVQAGMRDAVDRGFLWRIVKDSRSSYLFGTVHVAKLEWMFPGPQVLKALLASDTLALELDMLDPAIQRRLAQSMAARPAQAIPPSLAERLAGQARAACLPEAALARLSAPMQIATLTVLAARRDGLDPAYGIDAFLAGFGRSVNKAVISLETPELQMQALQGQDPVQTVAMVEDGLAELERGLTAPRLNRIAQAWADADYEQLARYPQWCDCLETASDRALMKRLLDQRNPELAARIAALHAGGASVFAAVGSLHMIGPAGLPALLRQRGFQVERIEFKH